MSKFQYFAVFDTPGKSTAFYNTDIYRDVVIYGELPEPTAEDPHPVPPEVSRARNPAIPEEAVEISESQWQELLDFPAERRWSGDGIEAYEPPPAPLAPLPAITDRQFGEGLWREKLISFDEYLAFVGPGTVPPPLLAIINTLPDDDTGNPTPRKVALGLVTGAQTYAFDNSLVDVVRRAQGWTEDYLRERWAEWALL